MMEIYQSLRSTIESLSSLSDEEWADIQQYWKPKEVKKHVHIRSMTALEDNAWFNGFLSIVNLVLMMF